MKGGGEERRGKWLSAVLQGSMKNEKQKKYSFYLRTFPTFFPALFLEPIVADSFSPLKAGIRGISIATSRGEGGIFIYII